MPNHRVKTAVDEAYQQILSDCFGLWSNSLWRYYSDLDEFSDLKGAFFYLVERLLMEGAIPHCQLVRTGMKVA